MTDNLNHNHSPTPRWTMGLRDLPDATASTRYKITAPDGNCIEATLKGRKRQVIDALAIGPLYCASTVRLGDAVHRLKQDHNISPETKATSEGRALYSLDAMVERIGGGS